jgi:hypothetical protein
MGPRNDRAARAPKRYLDELSSSGVSYSLAGDAETRATARAAWKAYEDGRVELDQ